MLGDSLPPTGFEAWLLTWGPVFVPPIFASVVGVMVSHYLGGKVAYLAAGVTLGMMAALMGTPIYLTLLYGTVIMLLFVLGSTRSQDPGE